MVYRAGGLELLEAFTEVSSHLLTRCLYCGFEGHYSLKYVRERGEIGERVCRACYWRTWAKDSRRLAHRDEPDWSEESEPAIDLGPLRRKAEANGYEYLRPLTDPSREHDPHAVKCKKCRRIEAVRAGDIGWRCPCQRNTKSNSHAPRRKPGQVVLFKDTGDSSVSWWDHEKNPPRRWATVRPRSSLVMWWNCPDGHSFQASVNEVYAYTYDACPECRVIREAKAKADREAEEHKYAGLTVADVPELAAAWAEDYPASEVLVLEHYYRGVRFRCPKGHTPRYFWPLNFLRSRCPSCEGIETRRKNAAKAEEDPLGHRLSAEIGAQWHPTRNGKKKLATVSPNSRVEVWWLDPVCGHEFKATPRERDKYQRLRCPECRTILDSLAFHYPELAEQWAPENDGSPWAVRPNGRLPVKPTWVCPADPEHRWQATTTSRVNGSGCPMCRTAGKSKIESLYADAARGVWDQVEQGQRVNSKAFSRRGSWSVDVLVTDGERRLVIEYDGAYWHQDKADIDAAKSLDLLSAGYWVCRVREHPLPPLPIEHERYMEVVAYATAPDPAAGVRAARDFFA